MTNQSKHPEYKLPDDAHAKHRYESAKKHAEAAKKAGKSSEEIHAVFREVMEFDPQNIDSIPTDEAHKKYRTAVIHAKKAIEHGKSGKEAHEVFHKIMEGNTTGHCHHH